MAMSVEVLTVFLLILLTSEFLCTIIEIDTGVPVDVILMPGEQTMLYSDLTKKAMLFAYRAHEGQVDKGGLPYIFHPLAVAEMMGDDEDAVVVALLHDVIEDTSITAQDLLCAGFSDEVVHSVVSISRRPGEAYMAYLGRVKDGVLARKVKLGDLKHNSDLGRLQFIDEHAISLHKRYQKAIAFLSED